MYVLESNINNKSWYVVTRILIQAELATCITPEKVPFVIQMFISVYRNFVVVNCAELQVAYRSNIIL